MTEARCLIVRALAMRLAVILTISCRVSCKSRVNYDKGAGDGGLLLSGLQLAAEFSAEMRQHFRRVPYHQESQRCCCLVDSHYRTKVELFMEACKRPGNT